MRTCLGMQTRIERAGGTKQHNFGVVNRTIIGPEPTVGDKIYIAISSKEMDQTIARD